MEDKPQDLFPVPSLPPSKLSPNPWPGINHQSTEALRAALRDNHERWHVFFDPRGYHNHSSHYLLALWALGADSEVIKAAYELDCVHQRPAINPPAAITAQNFKDHLGDDNYYHAYVNFYAGIIQSNDLSAVLEEYIFDLKVNYDPKKASDKQPEMLCRFLDAIVHPLIHVGYGLELGLPGMVVEGLASASVHRSGSTMLLPSSLWERKPVTMIDSLTSQLPSILSLGNKTSVSPSKNTHAFTILARILKDPQFDGIGRVPDMDIYPMVMKRYSDAIRNYASEWSYDSSNPKEVERKIEELVWANVVIYGIGGWSKDEEFDADFFYAHLVTSALFLSSVTAYIKPASQELLLRSYFVVSLAWWIGRGRAEFDIPGFFAEDTAYPTSPGPFPPPHEKALPSATSPKATTPNPWFHIIESSIAIPDDHLPKLQRALAHFGILYGTRVAGQPDFATTELPFADKIDGTLFIRAAGLTNKKLANVPGYSSMGAAGLWGRKGFYKS